jgi:hypothetical protein
MTRLALASPISSSSNTSSSAAAAATVRISETPTDVVPSTAAVLESTTTTTTTTSIFTAAPTSTAAPSATTPNGSVDAPTAVLRLGGSDTSTPVVVGVTIAGVGLALALVAVRRFRQELIVQRHERAQRAAARAMGGHHPPNPATAAMAQPFLQVPYNDRASITSGGTARGAGGPHRLGGWDYVDV